MKPIVRSLSRRMIGGTAILRKTPVLVEMRALNLAIGENAFARPLLYGNALAACSQKKACSGWLCRQELDGVGLNRGKERASSLTFPVAQCRRASSLGTAGTAV